MSDKIDGYRTEVRNGYYRIVLPSGRMAYHRYVWEKHHGEIPAGMQIHHIDKNPRNNRIENLALLPQVDHSRVHANWVQDEYGEWIAKPCAGCGKTKPLTSFHRHRKSWKSRCKPCERDAQRVYSATHREALSKNKKKYLANLPEDRKAELKERARLRELTPERKAYKREYKRRKRAEQKQLE